MCAVMLRTLSHKCSYAFWFPPSLRDIGGRARQYLFVVLPDPDPLLILTLFGLLVGGEWWFRRVFYIARFVLLAWDRAARFNSVRTADIAGRLLFSAPSYPPTMAEIEIIRISLSMNCHLEEIFCSLALECTAFMNINFCGLYAITTFF